MADARLALNQLGGWGFVIAAVDAAGAENLRGPSRRDGAVAEIEFLDAVALQASAREGDRKSVV